jgi:catechol 2,3-dioxygenase-like lactoylglutathione lyase family enzyme
MGSGEAFMKSISVFCLVIAAAVAGGWSARGWAQQPAQGGKMSLGRFSVSLAVKDIQASKEFYQKLGFEVIFGNQEQRWLILRSGSTVVGLFQGMFPKNTLTFNPQDVRALQRWLKSRGVPLKQEADEKTSGPAFAALEDPDGNPILLDQLEPKYMQDPD